MNVHHDFNGEPGIPGMANSTDERSRTVCQSCDLPYYASEGERPYCTTAGGSEAGGSGIEDVYGESPPGLPTGFKSALRI